MSNCTIPQIEKFEAALKDAKAAVAAAERVSEVSVSVKPSTKAGYRVILSTPIIVTGATERIADDVSKIIEESFQALAERLGEMSVDIMKEA